MSDLTEKLVNYLIEDHQRLATSAAPVGECPECPKLRDEIARWEGAAQGWEKQYAEQREPVAALQRELEQWGESNPRLTRDLTTMREAAEDTGKTDVSDALRFAQKSLEQWDEDPDVSLKSLKRAIHALEGKKP